MHLRFPALFAAAARRTLHRSSVAPLAREGYMSHGGRLHEAAQGSSVTELIAIDQPRVEIVFSIDNHPGALVDALQVFASAGLSLSHIESLQTKTRSARAEFMVNVVGTPTDPKVTAALDELRARRSVSAVKRIDPPVVPWFPTHISHIDAFSHKTLDAGAEIDSDHPGFADGVYRERRRAIVAAASSFRYGQPIPRVDYSKEEADTWSTVYTELRGFTRRYAVDAYNNVLPLLERHCGFGPGRVPQLQDVSEFLRAETGFTVRPVGGLLSARDFLNALAFRVFFSTQYLRHHSRPLYTPEPDLIHELMGHVPMLADPDFADFSQTIGLASLGASDEDIRRLASCYWFRWARPLLLWRGARQRRLY
jgi:phenylalanine-4-hydroxylase